jgi:hypothetical protein
MMAIAEYASAVAFKYLFLMPTDLLVQGEHPARRYRKVDILLRASVHATIGALSVSMVKRASGRDSVILEFAGSRRDPAAVARCPGDEAVGLRRSRYTVFW